QAPYSLAERDIERAELPAARYWDMAVLPWGILNNGVLTGKYTAGNTDPKRMDIAELDERRQHLVNVLQEVADEVGRKPSQVAINWVRQCPTAQVIPILGVRTLAQLEDNLAALEWELTPDQLDHLTKATGFEHGHPLNFVPRGAGPWVYGTTYERTDPHRPVSFETR
ncbi:MAG: aldo/keto reductase, partial [Chloroflexi bacterium]|nr:aldo/keto reductase [Chloroflexota bacterium]